MKNIFLISCLFLLLSPSPLFANNTEEISVGKTIGDGKNGNVWYQWRQTLKEKSVQRVTATLRKKKGGSDTYVNLRFGSKGALEGGKRINLNDGAPVTASWNIGGERPRGQKLVMNIYGGEAYLETVSIEYLEPISNKGANDHFGESGRRTNRPIDRDGRDRDFDRRDESEIARKCDRKRRLRVPEIEIEDVDSTGGLFSGKYRIKGSIMGACIEEAGYFEKGRLKQSFDYPFSDRYKRENFRIKVRSGKRGEIRILSYDGGEERLFVDDIINDKPNSNRNRNRNGNTGSILDVIPLN